MRKSINKRLALLLGAVVPVGLLVWAREVRSWQPRTLPQRAMMRDMAFSPTDSTLAMMARWSVDGSMLQSYHTKARKLAWKHHGDWYRVVYSPDGSRLATASFSTASPVVVRDAHTGRQLRTLTPFPPNKPATIAAMGFGGDSRTFVIQAGVWLFRYNVETGTLLEKMRFTRRWGAPLQNNTKNDASHSERRISRIIHTAPRSNALLAEVRLTQIGNHSLTPPRWEMWVCDSKAHPQFLLAQSRVPFFTGTFSSDGRYVITPRRPTALLTLRMLRKAAPPPLQIWDVAAHRVLKTIIPPPGQRFGRVESALLTRDGKRLFIPIYTVQAKYNTLKQPGVAVWNLETNRLERQILAGPVRTLDSDLLLALSPDETTLTVADNNTFNRNVQLWRVK